MRTVQQTSETSSTQYLVNFASCREVSRSYGGLGLLRKS